MEKTTQKYLVLVKIDPAKTANFIDSLSNLAEKPLSGVRLDASYNVFGNWDIAVWFDADSNDNAIHFVGDTIRPMDGVLETLTMPATSIKQYQRM